MFVMLVIGSGVVMFATGIVIAGIGYERLVDVQFETRHEEWVSAGRPKGGRCTRSELSFFTSDLASVTQCEEWLFSTPEWITSEPRAAAASKLTRRGVAVAAAGAVITALGILGLLRLLA